MGSKIIFSSIIVIRIVRYISWLVSKVCNLKWKIYVGQKKKPCCEINKFSRQKWLRKMHLKNMVIPYKSWILKFKIQQKVKWYVSMFSIYFIFTKKHFLSEKIAKTPKLLDSLRKLHVFCILNTLKVICCCFEENFKHLNVSFRIFFV